MAVVVDMPKLSDTMEEGGVAEWFKKEGDEVEEGELLLAIETDKATMEYSSPEEGTLLKIVVPAGKTVSLGQPLAVLGVKGEVPDYESLLSGRGKNPEKSPEKASGLSTAQDSPALPLNAGGDSGLKSGFAAAGEAPPIADERLRVSPLAKKIAQEKGLNLHMIQGSGPHGRIIQRDVAKAQPAALQSVGNLVAPVGADEVIPNSMMRKTIAKRLLAGKNEAPHFYLTVSADMQAVLDWRQKINSDPGVEKGLLLRVSVNDLIILAVGRALRQHPEVNASWSEENITRHGRVDVCMAVALPTGLVTPVIRNADQLKVRSIARQSRALANKAREGGLSPEEYTGGTFTISNLGMTGVEEFTAIINPPQACILAVGKTQAVPWVDEKDQLVVRRRMKMTLSCDHRVVDGMVGARFLETLVSYLENPLLMLS